MPIKYTCASTLSIHRRLRTQAGHGIHEPMPGIPAHLHIWAYMLCGHWGISAVFNQCPNPAPRLVSHKITRPVPRSSHDRTFSDVVSCFVLRKCDLQKDKVVGAASALF